MGKIWVIGLLSSAMGKSIGRQKRLAESVQLDGQYCIKSDLPQMEWGRYNQTVVDALTDENLVGGTLIPYSCYENPLYQPLLDNEEERFMQCQCLPDYGHFDKVGSPTKICTWKPLGRFSDVSYLCDRQLLYKAVDSNAGNYLRIKGELNELNEELVTDTRDAANNVAQLISDNEKAIVQLREDLKKSAEEREANDKVITMEVNSKWQDMLATHFMNYEMTELETSREITEAWNELQLNLTQEITQNTLSNKRKAETMSKAYVRQMLNNVNGWSQTHVYDYLQSIWGNSSVIADDPTALLDLVQLYGSGSASASIPAPTLDDPSATDGTLAQGGLLTELEGLITTENSSMITFIGNEAPTAAAQQDWYKDIRNVFYNPAQYKNYSGSYTPCDTTCKPVAYESGTGVYEDESGATCTPAAGTDCDEVNIALEELSQLEKAELQTQIDAFELNYDMKIELATDVERMIELANATSLTDEQMRENITTVLKTQIDKMKDDEIKNFYLDFRDIADHTLVYKNSQNYSTLAQAQAAGEIVELGANSQVALVSAAFNASIGPLEDRIRDKLDQAEKDMAKKNKNAREDAVGQAWLYVQDLQTKLQHQLTSDMHRERHKISNGLWDRKQRLRTVLTESEAEIDAKIAAADLTYEEPMEARLGEVTSTADKGMAKAEEHIAQIQATSVDRLYKQGNFSVELIGGIKSAISDKLAKLVQAVQFEMSHSRHQVDTLRANHFY